MTLATKFFDTFPKRGTDGSKMEKLVRGLKPENGRDLAISADELGRHMAQLLIEMTNPEIGLARTYARGYPARGPASNIVRKKAELMVNPDHVKAEKLS